MRSNPILALTALVLVAAATGCSVNRVACDSGHGRLIHSGCDAGCSTGCDERCSTGLQRRIGGGIFGRGTQCETGCDSGQCGTGWAGPLGVVSVSRTTNCDQGCGRGGLLGRGGAGCQGCADGCQGGGLGGSRWGNGLFAQGYCETDDCWGGQGVALAGGAADGMGFGCGRFGCGRNGNLCSGCRGRMGGRGIVGRNHPYGGEIPHTDPYAYGYGMAGDCGGMGSGPVNYAYPYYTTRGPRDFLMANPPSIGW